MIKISNNNNNNNNNNNDAIYPGSSHHQRCYSVKPSKIIVQIQKKENKNSFKFFSCLRKQRGRLIRAQGFNPHRGRGFMSRSNHLAGVVLPLLGRSYK